MQDDILIDMLMKQRQALIMGLGAVEDALIAMDRLKERSIVPKHKREYNPPKEATTWTQSTRYK